MRRYGRPLERSFIPPTMIRIFVLLFDLFQKERNTSHHLHSSFRPTLQRNKKELEWNTNSNLHLFLKWLTLFFFNQKENHWWFFVVAIKSGRWRPPSTSVRLSCFWDSSTSSSKMKSSTVLLLSLSVALAMGQNYYLQFSGAPKEAPLYPPSANDVAPYYVADEVRPKQVHHFRWFSSLNRIQIRSPSIGKIWR